MMPEDVVKCLCGAKDWESGGSTISPTFSDQMFTCRRCCQAIWILQGYGCGPLALFHPKAMAVAAVEWVNGPMMAQWRFVKGEFDKTHPYTEGKPGSWPETPTPPWMPQGLVAFLGDRGEDKLMVWKGPYDHENTSGVRAPEDPIFTRHKEHWTKLLAELGVKDYTVVKNRYCGSKLEPWYKFRLNHSEVVVGPRKRVDVIEVETLLPFDNKELEAAAKRDNTTFYGNGVHAWTRGKFIEYFRIIEKALADRPLPTQEERINLLEHKRAQIQDEEVRHREAEERLRDELRSLLDLPNCTHYRKDGMSAKENVSDHGSSYKCRYCELM